MPLTDLKVGRAAGRETERRPMGAPDKKDQIMRSLLTAALAAAAFLAAAADSGAIIRLAQGNAEIPSSAIGEAVLQQLKQVDHVAYIRFASVYREFTDLEDLKREVEDLSIVDGS